MRAMIGHSTSQTTRSCRGAALALSCLAVFAHPLLAGAQPANPDLVFNGDYSDGMNGWHANVAASASASPDSSGQELCITIGAPGTNIWDITTFQKYLPLETGAAYQLRYDARASAPRAIDIKLGRKDAPWTTYAYFTAGLATSSQTYIHTFTMPAANDACGNLEFHLGGRGAIDVCLDNVRLERLAPGSFPHPPAPGPPPSNSLRGHADTIGMRVGASMNAEQFYCEPKYTQTLVREFNRTTPENGLKFAPLRPDPTTWAFHDPDTMLDFASDHGIEFHGHTLVWHQDLPSWLTQGSWTESELRAILQQHIQTVVGHYAGQIPTWDVVSEALAPDGTMRDTYWLQGIGPDYIDLAFQAAHAADPNAILIYNDFGIEASGTKPDAAFALVADLVQRGIPIHGVGFQAHFRLASPAASAIAANMARYAAIGIDVYLSEVDVALAEPATQTDLEAQAVLYADLLEACRAAPNCHDFVTWGLTDKFSWIPIYFPGFGSALLFDEDYEPKPAYYAMRSVLAEFSSVPALSGWGVGVLVVALATLRRWSSTKARASRRPESDPRGASNAGLP